MAVTAPYLCATYSYSLSCSFSVKAHPTPFRSNASSFPYLNTTHHLKSRQLLRRRFRVVCCLPPSSSATASFSASSSTKLYVSGLSFRTTKESLTNAFENFGQLIEVNLVMDRIANRPRGFAFLHYAKEEESKAAIEGMHGKFLDGRVIFVEVAKPRSRIRQDFNQSSRQ